MDVSALKQFAIKAGADPESLTRRSLTWDEYNAMGEAEQHFHCVANSKAVDAVHESHSKDVRQVRTLSKTAVAKLYADESESPEVDRENAIHNFQVFMASYPQYINLPVQAGEILEWLRVNSLYPEVEHIVTAFKTLAREGELKIDPSQTGLIDETELTGKALEFHPQVNRLLESVTPEIAEQRRVMRMSESDFKKWEHEQLGPKHIPWLINERVKQAFTTLAANHPEFRFNSDTNKERLLAHLDKFGTTIDAKNVELAYQSLKAAGELDLNPNVSVQTEHATWTGYEQMDGRTFTEKQESLGNKIAA
jgi:hypothetical protein